eukprot:gene14592-19593_t
MGGNAIKKVKTSRMSKTAYETIKSDVFNRLNLFIQMFYLKDLPEKSSFGDIDIVYLSENKNISIVDLLQEVFNPAEIVKSGEITSFAYEFIQDNVVTYHQIDLIFCDSIENWKILEFYFSYGDVGGLLGRILNYYGIKIGHKGLYLNLLNDTLQAYQFSLNNMKSKTSFESDNNSNEILLDLNQHGLALADISDNSDSHENNDNNESLTIESINFTKNSSSTSTIAVVMLTNNVEEICDYLHLNYEQWSKGFSNNLEIFEWLTKCRFFKASAFHSLNSDHRKRLKIRPFYQAFLDYISSLKDFNNITNATNDNNISITVTSVGIGTGAIDNEKTGERQFNYQLQSIKDFNKQYLLDEIIANKELLKERSNKFNGKLLMSKYLIPQLEVGVFIIGFKSYIISNNNNNKCSNSNDKQEFSELWESWLDNKSVEDVDLAIKEYINSMNA